TGVVLAEDQAGNCDNKQEQGGEGKDREKGDRCGQNEAIVCNQLNSCTVEHLPHPAELLDHVRRLLLPRTICEYALEREPGTHALTVKSLHSSGPHLLDARA